MKSQAPTMNSFTNSTNDLLTKKRSQSNASNYSSSQVMDYFKDKFGSPTHDVTHALSLGRVNVEKAKSYPGIEENSIDCFEMQLPIQQLDAFDLRHRRQGSCGGQN